MMKGGLGNLMKQAQQMQENMKKMQDSLGSVEVEGQAGAGMVKVTMTCHHDVKRVSIDPSLMTEDKEMLEDLLAAAVNDANRRVDVHELGRLRRPKRLGSLVAANKVGGAPVEHDAAQVSELTQAPREVLGLAVLPRLARVVRCLS